MPDERNLPRVKNYLLSERNLPRALLDSLITSGNLYADNHANAGFKENLMISVRTVFCRGTGGTDLNIQGPPSHLLDGRGPCQPRFFPPKVIMSPLMDALKKAPSCS